MIVHAVEIERFHYIFRSPLRRISTLVDRAVIFIALVAMAKLCSCAAADDDVAVDVVVVTGISHARVTAWVLVFAKYGFDLLRQCYC